MTLGCILDFKYAFTTFAILAKFLKKKYWYYRGLISFINKKKRGSHGALFGHGLVIKKI